MKSFFYILPVISFLYGCSGDENEMTIDDLNSPCDCATVLNKKTKALQDALDDMKDAKEISFTQKSEYANLKEEYQKFSKHCSNKFDLNAIRECKDFKER